MMTLRKLRLSALIAMTGLALLTAAGARGEGLDSAPTLVRPNSAGFIQRWLILEPIRANGLTDSAVKTAVKTQYFS